MFKKILSVLLIFNMMNFSILPTFAKSEKVRTGNIVEAEFKTELDVNKASKGEVVQFITTEDYNINGISIPKGTILSGSVKHFKKGRFGYRRAKAIVFIDKMILPNGETRNIKAFTKKHVLKGSAMANVGKGIVTFPFAIVTGAVGGVVIFVEAVSIVGILLIGPTSYGFGRAMGSLTNGVNCKKNIGDEIKIKIKSL